MLQGRSHHVSLNYQPMQNMRRITQWLKGTGSPMLLQEFSHLRRRTLLNAYLIHHLQLFSSGTTARNA